MAVCQSEIKPGQTLEILVDERNSKMSETHQFVCIKKTLEVNRMKSVILLLVLTLGFGFAQDQAAPDFTMYDTAGKIVKRSNFLGKPVIVTFWATWCETCAVEMPLLSKRFAKLKNKLVFLAVSRDGSQAAKEVIDFVKPKKWTFSHVLVNPPAGSSKADTIDAVTKRYGIYGQPWSFFIDAKGIIKALRGGISSEAEFKTDLAKIGVKY